MKKKFYAVVNGRKKGIFFDWATTKESIDGFKNAKYKSFENLDDAAKYIEENESGNISKKKNEIDIKQMLLKDSIDNIYSFFVDGSYNVRNKKIGYGIVCYKDSILEQISKSLSPSDSKKYGDSWNVAGEIFGTIHAIQYAIDKKYKVIKIYYDYEGIEKWVTNKWKANSNIAIMYKAFFDTLKNDDIEVRFQKVKAHSGIELNELADKLAKKAIF